MDVVVLFPAEALLCYFVPTALFFWWRKPIIRQLSGLLQERQRFKDGAFIAALLANESDAGMIKDAGRLFRGVPASRITADILKSSKGSPEEFALSQPCKLGEIDYFISHSWSDDADLKFAHLAAMTADFQSTRGREPIMWFDKLCIDQDNIADALRCLPIFVSSCDRLLILCGDTCKKTMTRATHTPDS